MITTQEIAEKFGLTVGTVRMYLHNRNRTHPRAAQIRKYASENGWYEHMKKCATCGKEFKPGSNVAKYCPECKAKVYSNGYKRYLEKVNGTYRWFNGCFHTRAEEISRMNELREEGYSNIEIAKKIGRSQSSVLRTIGAQPKEMSEKNRVMARKIDAQKNAARKQYVINKSIEDYNKTVDEVRAVEEHLEKLKQDLTIKEMIAKKNARRTVKTPSIDLSTTQIAG